MSDDLPEPPVPASADLRDFPFTPIFRSRLFGSSFHARTTDGEWRAGVTLWLKSWDQVPAGSLPDDETDLCRLAELGRDVKAWKKLRAGALHGWVKHRDGRLYHSVVAEGVNEALSRKAEQRARTGRARIAALQKRLAEAKTEDARARITEEINTLSHTLSQTRKAAPVASVTEQPPPSVTDSVTESKGQGQGQEERKKEDSDLRSGDEAAAAPRSARDELWQHGKLIIRNLTGVSASSAGSLLGSLLKDAGDDCARVLAILREAEDLRPLDPAAWLKAAAKAAKTTGGRKAKTDYLNLYDPPRPSPFDAPHTIDADWPGAAQ